MTSSIMTLKECIVALGLPEAVPRETASQQSESERWEKDPEHHRTIEFYGRYIETRPDARVLDVGAGAGKVAIKVALLPNVASIVAYDMSLSAMKPLVEGVRQRIETTPELAKIYFSTAGNPWSLPFEREAFDVVICRYSMHHFADQPGAMREMQRCLRSKGLLLYSDPAMPEHSRDTTHGLYLLREDNFHGYRTYHEMINLVVGQQFRILAVRPYDYQRGTLDDYLKAAEPALKEHLIRAWCGLDEKTKSELKLSGQREGPFITYPIIDIASEVLSDADMVCI